MVENMQLLSFDNLAQRVLFRYAFTFADFTPIESVTVSVDAQRAFHDICGAIVRGIANDPTILGLPVDHPDQWLEAHHVMSMYPTLYKVRNACQNAFYELSGFLFAAGLHGEYHDGRLSVCISDMPKLTAKTLGIYLKLLGHYGMFIEKGSDTLMFEFSACPEALTAWQLLAAKCSEYQDREREQAVRFALWIHDGDGAYFLERIRTLLGLDDGFFDYVAEKYLAKGYKVRFEVDEYSAKYLYTKDVGGLSISYSTLWGTVCFVNNTSIGVKAVLEHADELETGIKHQLIRFCKSCNDCMVCTKGGKNKQFTVTVHHDGNEYRLCPEFVQMQWNNSDISREKIDFMLELNELQEQFGKNWRKKK